MNKLAGHTKDEWRKVKKIVAPILNTPPGPTLTRKAITLLESAVQDAPDEWAYWYALGEYYHRFDDWTSCVRAGRRCYTLRPNDVRSAYALATALRFWAEEHGRYTFDGHDAVQAAYALFTQVVNAPIPWWRRRFVKRHIAALTRKYPDLISQTQGDEQVRSPPPSSRPSRFRRFFNAYRAGRLLALLFLLLASLGLCTNVLEETRYTNPPLYRTSSTPDPLALTFASAGPPTDTLTLTVTWDQWGDIQAAAWAIWGEISGTLEFTGDTLPPSIVEQSRSTMSRFEELGNIVIDQAYIQIDHIPDDELDTIFDHQLQRQQDLLDLLITLDNARAEALQIPEPTPSAPSSTCIRWNQASTHVGENTCVYGDVYSTYDSGKAFFINFSPHTTSFYAVSFDWTWEDLENTCIEVRGAIETYQGRPQIIIHDPDQLQDCD